MVLYDNNRRQAATSSAGGGGGGISGSGAGSGGGKQSGVGDVALLDPRVIARKELTDSELVIVDAGAFRAFQVCGRLVWGLWGCGVVGLMPLPLPLA